MKNLENSLRFQSDRRQVGGLLMLFGFMAIIQPLSEIAAGFGNNGTSFTKNGQEYPIWLLIGLLCLFFNGVASVIIGYLATVHDWSHKAVTICLLLTIQTTLIWYISDMAYIGKESRKDPYDSSLVPNAYNPTAGDVRFAGAMGIVAIFSYGFTYIGGFAVLALSLHYLNIKKPEKLNSGYFKCNLFLFSIMLFVAGLVQLMLGSYCNSNLSAGKLHDGPVKAAMLLVSYPGLAVFIGLIQMVNSVWGMVRACGFHFGEKDVLFPVSILIQWFFVVLCQEGAEISYPASDSYNAFAPTFIAVSFALNVMPAYLDHMMRKMPDVIPETYYVSGSEPEPSATYTKDEHGEEGQGEARV